MNIIILGGIILRIFNPNYSLVRVLHAVPDGEVVDVYINDTLFFSDLVFRQFSPYIYTRRFISD